MLDLRTGIDVGEWATLPNEHVLNHISQGRFYIPDEL